VGATRLRDALVVLGSVTGPCGFCGHPDQRHRVADVITERVLAGEDAQVVWSDYRDGNGQVHVLELTIAVLAADPRRHGITRGKAARIDREVWADL
jgi:hypothetical protein